MTSDKIIRLIRLALLAILFVAVRPAPTEANQEPWRYIPVLPGDTWTALAARFDIDVATLQAMNPHPNRQRQPVIGSSIAVPGEATERTGTLVRGVNGGLLAIAAREGHNPWHLAGLNGLATPYRPLLDETLFLPDAESTPRELPGGFQSLELSAVPALPGKALGWRATVMGETAVRSTLEAAMLDPIPLQPFQQGSNLVALAGTGAFYPPGDHVLTILVDGGPLWSQPWRMVDDTWTYNQLTLTGEAAQIDQEAIAEERARLFEIWSVVTPEPQWDSAFQLPINDFMAYSSLYGARRSYNGGPYRTYHEGLDFSAYGGTPVYAPAAGTVVLAERLYVRGGAVLIDHGLGIYSGFYHMSAVHAQVGQQVAPGDLIGEVGTTGLSTGNHLHWDLLVGGTWVDPAAWMAGDTACWILEGWGERCQPASGDG